MSLNKMRQSSNITLKKFKNRTTANATETHMSTEPYLQDIENNSFMFFRFAETTMKLVQITYHSFPSLVIKPHTVKHYKNSDKYF